MSYAGVGIEVLAVDGAQEQRLQRILRHLEWTAVLITACGQLAWTSIFVYFDNSIAVSFLLLGLNLLASVPSPRTVRPRIVQLLAQTALISGAGALGAHHFFYLNLYFVAAKAALWLPRKQMLAVAALIAISQIAAGQYAQYALHHIHVVTGAPRRDLTTFNEIRNCIYFAISLLAVSFLGRALIAQRASRDKEQKLSKDVEQLAIKLERARIARDIHDGLGHRFTSLRIQLELALKMLEQKNTTDSKKLLVQCEDTARSSMQEVRRAIRAATDRYFVNLKDAVSELIRQTNQNNQLDVQVAISDIALPIRSQHQLYSLIQECLTNVRKHAIATRVEISLTGEQGLATLRVRDNGRGFNPATKPAGFGLKGMRERAEAVGGTLKIESSHGKGTEMIVSFPIATIAGKTNTTNVKQA